MQRVNLGWILNWTKQTKTAKKKVSVVLFCRSCQLKFVEFLTVTPLRRTEEQQCKW